MKEKKTMSRLTCKREVLARSYAITHLNRMGSVTYQNDCSYEEQISEEITRAVEPRRVRLQGAAIGEHYRWVSMAESLSLHEVVLK
jgi:hypothetical protein